MAILANAGGVVVSYFEWVQGLQKYERELPLRVAAHGLALQRVASATTIRSIYP